MYCADCGEETEASPCVACGRPALLDERFRLEAMLGRGAYGTTWRARAGTHAPVVLAARMKRQRSDELQDVVEELRLALGGIPLAEAPAQIEQEMADASKTERADAARRRAARQKQER